MSPTPHWQHRYPALIACIGEGREPSAQEVRRVAIRMAREAFPEKFAGASFRLSDYRTVCRAAQVALQGKS